MTIATRPPCPAGPQELEHDGEVTAGCGDEKSEEVAL